MLASPEGLRRLHNGPKMTNYSGESASVQYMRVRLEWCGYACIHVPYTFRQALGAPLAAAASDPHACSTGKLTTRV